MMHKPAELLGGDGTEPGLKSKNWKGVAPCFIMEIIYPRGTHLREWMKLSEGNLYVFLQWQVYSVDLKPSDTFSKNVCAQDRTF